MAGINEGIKTNRLAMYSILSCSHGLVLQQVHINEP
jgi:hypothetical protein